MESYLMMLYVTLEQETALKTFFIAQGWAFQKPDLSVTTDKLGPVIKPSAEAYAPSQAETLIVPDPENTPGSSGKSKPRPLGKRNYKSSFAKEPFAKVPRIQDQPACSSGSFNPTHESENITERSDNVVIITADDQTDVVAFEPIPFDDGNSAIIKKEYVDTEYEHGNNAGMGNDSIGPDERHDYNLSAGSADQDVFMCLNTTEGELGQTEQKDITAEQSKQPKADRPRTGAKKRGHYSQSSLVSAFNAVKEQGMPVIRAALQYNIPETTLRDRVLGKVDLHAFPQGQKPIFTNEEEAAFIDHLKTMASFGYGYTQDEILQKASNYAVYLGKRSNDQNLSMKWIKGFKKRWPNLNTVSQKEVNRKRTNLSLEKVFHDYFIDLNIKLTEYDLKSKPEYVYSFDKVSIQTKDPQPTVINEDDDSLPDSTFTTLLACGNAAGVKIPPYFVFEGIRLNKELVKDSSAGSSCCCSESGLLDSNSFYHYLNDHFLKHVQRPNKEQPVLLLLDGYKSHVNITSLRLAKENNVIIHMLPPNTSQYLSPIGTKLFDLFQQKYVSECHKFLKACPNSRITKFNIGKLAGVAYNSAMCAENLNLYFEKTGIYPFQPSKIGEVDSS